MSLINRLSHRPSFPLILSVPVLLYFAVALFWHSRHFYVITGDEPHYLLVSDSLVRDHDLLVENNYSINTPVHQAAGVKLSRPEHLAKHAHDQFSSHSPGLPVLLAIPYWIGGVLGAKLFMALLSGLWPLLLYKILSEIVGSRLWSVIIAFVLTIGLPFSAASNQIYPDLLGGMIILFVTWKLFARLQARGQPSFSVLTELWVGLLIAFLPWLHGRFVGPAILLLLGYTYVGTRKSDQGSSRLFRRQLLLPAGIVVCSLVLFGIYAHVAFGNFFGPYGRTDVTFEINKIVMIFLGLHWDQSQGMFIQQPLLLLGLIGIPILIKENRQGAILLGIVYLSVLLPNALHPAWYGGFSFVGRFWWTVVSLWIFPLAYAVRTLLKKNELFLIFLCLAGLALQGWLATRWLLHDSLLLNQNNPVWAARSFFDQAGLFTYLPTFRDFDTYLKHPANYIAVMLGLLLTITGWLWQRGANRSLGKMLGAFLVVGVSTVLLISPATSSWKLKAFELPSHIGTIEGTDRVATEKDGSGFLTFGPYAVLVSGSYEVALDYESTPAAIGEIAHFWVVYDLGSKVVADLELTPSDASQGTAKLAFQVSQEQSLKSVFEFPVSYVGRGILRVKRLTITRIDY